jgi:hypothetical protein
VARDKLRVREVRLGDYTVRADATGVRLARAGASVGRFTWTGGHVHDPASGGGIYEFGMAWDVWAAAVQDLLGIAIPGDFRPEWADEERP